MGLPNEVNNLMIGSLDYQIARSLRLRSSAGGHFTRTPGVAGNRRTWTLSTWVKRGTLTTENPIFAARASDTDRVFIGFDGTTDQLQLFANPSGGINVATAAALRDPSAWYHTVVSFDTTQATAANRVRMWVNGVSQSFSASSFRYVRWVITNLRNFSTAVAVQAAEFYLYSGATRLSYAGATITNPGGSSPGGEEIDKLIDGNVNTKWLDFNIKTLNTSTVVIDFGSARTFDSYSYVTANDSTERDPTSWTVEGSNDNSNWTVLSTVTNATITTSRFTETQTFSASGAVLPNQNTDWAINNTNSHQIGRTSVTTGVYFDGYLAEMHFIDGQSLTAASFGLTDPVTGVWKPRRYTGTYGTNGFYLPFTDNSGSTATTIGRDFSGNGNNYTPANISVTAGSTFDSMLDSPTSYADGGNGRGNYCVLDRLSVIGSGAATYGSVSDGNLIATTATTTGSGVSSTMAVNIPAGQRWYWEVTPTSGVTTATTACQIGVIERSGADGFGGTTYDYSSSDATAYTNGDVIGCAYDGTTSTAFFYKNNVLAKTVTGASSSFPLLPFIRDNLNPGSITARFNFGQQPFVYTPPAGYRALNTQNIPTPTILDGRRYMTATTYTGTGSSQTISNGRFYPDLVWIKSRSAATSHELTDSVRGVTRSIATNSDAAEVIDTNGVTAFTTTGFTVGTDSSYNNNATTYVAWQWNANSGSSASNSAGAITSTVSVNQLAGFSVVTYTGVNNNGTSTVGHGLGVAPGMVIVKNRGAASTNWMMGHASIPNAMIRMNTNDAQVTANVTLAANAFTSSTFSVRSISAGLAGDNINNVSNTYVAYCFAPVAGFSAFGSYTGNANTDGPMVWCGFRPSFVFIKNINISSVWPLYDSARNPTNLANFMLRVTGTDVEFTGIPAGNEPIDFLSNGFKVRGTGGSGNANANTFIYAAFAESPFKYALGR